MLRRVQNLDWLTTKTEASIEQLRTNVDDLKEGIEKNGGSMTSSRYTAAYTNYPDHSNNGRNNHRSRDNKEIEDKLESLAILITSTRSAIHRIERDFHATGANISSLLQSNK